MSAPPKPLSPVVQAAYDEAVAHVTALPTRLFTPQAWAQVAMREATEQLGTLEGAAKLAEAKRYMACTELANRLLMRIHELEHAARGRAS